MTGESSLITADEAEEVVFETKYNRKWRLLAIILSSSSLILTATLVIMILLSLRGARIGLEAIFPFLDNRPSQDLQLPSS